MIIGLGLDLFDVARLEAALRRHGPDAGLDVFSPDELARSRAHRDASRALASCFAAKEAVFKALSLDAREGWRWRDVEVTAEAGAPPVLTLHGRLAALARQRRVGRILLSLAVTRRYAVATVVLEERP